MEQRAPRAFSVPSWLKAPTVQTLLVLVLTEILLRKGLTLAANSVGGLDPRMSRLPTTGLGLGWYVAFPLAVTAMLLLAFSRYAGLSAREMVPPAVFRRSWMWLAPAGLAATALAVAVRAHPTVPSVGWIVMLALGSLCIGFGEELAYRGILPALMRRSRWGEFRVALVSSGLFGLIHIGAMLRGQGLSETIDQIVMAFFAGLAFFIILLVTRSLIWPMLLHALWDFSLFLQNPTASEPVSTNGSPLGGGLTGLLLAVIAMTPFIVGVLGLIVLWRHRALGSDAT